MDFDRDDYRELKGRTVWINTGCGKLFVTMNYLIVTEDGKEIEKLVEIVFNMGRSGGCGNATLETMGRMGSKSLQKGIDLPTIVKQLQGVYCQRVAFDESFHQVRSCTDGASLVLAKYHGLERKIKESGEVLERTCENCGSDNIMWEGRCYTCSNCGHSKC